MNDILRNSLMLRRIRLDIYLCTQCDLKCKYCYRFCNIADNDNYDYNHLIKDLTKLKKKNIAFRKFILNGGEPLLYPNLLDSFKRIRNIFPNIPICLQTNGKQFLKKADILIPAMKESNINLNISEYRKTNIDYNKLFNLCSKAGILYNDVWSIRLNNKEVQFDTEKIGMKKKSMQETLINYQNKCRCTCICLWKGKFYRCGKSAWINILNKKYNTEFKVAEDDYLDVDSVNSTKQLLNFIKTPGSFCRYCFNNKSGANDCCPWSNDSPSKSDWIVEEE